MLSEPLAVYINWSAYDELSDAVELTEAIAMRQLDELLRLRREGVRLDYYLMDCFWYARDGGYRTWRRPHWSDDGDRWLEACREHGVKPGLWVGSNNLVTSRVDPLPEWRDSLTASGMHACWFHGGFTAHFFESLHRWYERGVRLFKFDFCHLGAATPELERTLLPSEIHAMNSSALQAALRRFRHEHPEVVFVAYNGFEETVMQGTTDRPFAKSMDARWLDAFDAFYTGDPRPADVPAASFWRSKDVYSDHMVRAYLDQGFDARRLDNAGFMIGTTGTCYHRGKLAWKPMLALSLARGGWLNTYYGNLDLLDGEDARWFARIQSWWLGLQAAGRHLAFGGVPGRAEPYGFANVAGDDALMAVVNPSQAMVELEVPGSGEARVLFHDAGYVPVLNAGRVRLAPEQMAVIGRGRFADAACDLGSDQDSRVAGTIAELPSTAVVAAGPMLQTTATAPASGALRIVMRQRDRHGQAKRTSGGSPPKGTSLGKLLTLRAEQDGREVAIDIAYDKAIWSGLSWAVGEIPAGRLRPGAPVTITGTSSEGAAVRLELVCRAVTYAAPAAAAGAASR